jgi:DUF4097 and DUF4098 domain-containing protein YvlB
VFGSLLKSKPTRAANGTPSRAASPSTSTSTRLTVDIRLVGAQLALTCGPRTDVQVDGANVEHESDKLVITEQPTKNDRDPRPICRVEVPRGAIVEIASEFGGVAVFNFHGTLRARLQHGNAHFNHLDGRFRVVSGYGSIVLEHVRGAFDVITGSGNISAQHVDADLQLVSDAGSIELEDIDGPLVARSTTGGVTARDLNGLARLSTRTGAIAVTGASRQLTVRTQNGDIAVDTSVVDHTTLESQKGSIEVRLGRATDARIDASARQGVVRTERLTLSTGSGRRAVRSTLGEGRARLQVATGMGLIEISGPRPVVV